MKMTYKNLLYPVFGALICLFLALPASAQRTSNGGSSGGSSHSSGGGGSHPSGGSGSRPSGGGSGGSRPASYSRPAGNPGVARTSGGQRPPAQGYVNRQGGAVRGNYGTAPRTGVVVQGNYGGHAVNSYRTAPAIGYNGYWGNHGYYSYNRGYYNTYYRPRLGFTVGLLPYGYYPFYWGDYQYFYSDGLYYQYDNSQYTVVEPPIGAEVTALPDKAQSIVINGVQYYELNGVYYQSVTKDDGTVVYEIVGKDGQLTTSDGGAQVQNQQPQGPQMGDVVTQLPDNCRKIKVNGTKLWVSADGIYYQEQTDANGNKTYKIVGLPSDEPDQGQQNQ
jgi:hypothetical protein